MKKSPDIEVCIENFELLLEKYDPLIKKTIGQIMVKYKSTYGFEYEDLYQEANLAIWNTIKHFDKTKGISYGAYLMTALKNWLNNYSRSFLPHYFKKTDVIGKNGKNVFKTIFVSVSSTDDDSFVSF